MYCPHKLEQSNFSHSFRPFIFTDVHFQFFLFVSTKAKQNLTRQADGWGFRRDLNGTVHLVSVRRRRRYDWTYNKITCTGEINSKWLQFATCGCFFFAHFAIWGLMLLDRFFNRTYTLDANSIMGNRKTKQ